MSDGRNKLFHVLVVVGASMTGAACGGATASESVDPDAARDAALDAKDAMADHYVGISPPPCGTTGPGGHACDAGYPQIAPNLDGGGIDAYPPIVPPPLDSGETDGYPAIVPPPFDGGEADGYPQIAPNLDGGYPPIH